MYIASGKLSDFLDPTGPDQRAVQPQTSNILQNTGRDPKSNYEDSLLGY